jgi:hypothetical protein
MANDPSSACDLLAALQAAYFVSPGEFFAMEF